VGSWRDTCDFDPLGGGVLDCNFPLEGMNLWLSESKDLVSWVGFRLGSLVLMLQLIAEFLFGVFSSLS
jgi:hypothetical protein